MWETIARDRDIWERHGRHGQTEMGHGGRREDSYRKPVTTITGIFSNIGHMITYLIIHY